jgi:hypothetical protein
MALPKIDLPIFELKLVSVSDPIRFRPFLVKEEKLLLMALQSSNDAEIMSTIKQVINNCLVDELDIDKIPIFDIEYLFLNIRARSIGEKVETYYVCRNVVGKTKTEEGLDEDVQCMHMMPIEVNLLDIKPPIDDLPTKIYITKDIGIQLKYPNLKTFKSMDNLLMSEGSKEVFDMIFSCTEYIFDKDELHYASETDKEEFYAFLDSLTQEQFDKITDFFELLPTITYNIQHDCQKCGFHHELTMEGLNDFFI